MGPWNADQIAQARRVRFSVVLEQLGAYHKVDKDYEPLDPSRKSIRVHVNYQGRDFRFVITEEKFVNELQPDDAPRRGGGGAIDFVQHITGFGFVQAVNVCLAAAGT